MIMRERDEMRGEEREEQEPRSGTVEITSSINGRR